MSSDIDYWCDSYRGAIEELEALVVLLTQSPVDTRENVVTECSAKLSRAQSIKKSYYLEMRLLRNKEIKGTHERKLKKIEMRCAVLGHEIEWAQQAGRRRKLLTSQACHDEFKGNDEYLDGADKIQDQTQDALSRTMNLVEASKEIGQSTLNELESQQEQIKDITADILIIEDNLSRADKLIRNFTKRMMTDKLIMCFSFLNMCGLVGIILYCVVTGKGLGAEDEKEDNPNERRRMLRGFSGY